MTYQLSHISDECEVLGPASVQVPRDRVGSVSQGVECARAASSIVGLTT